MKLLYHSGAGSTKTIAELLYSKLQNIITCVEPISLNYDYNNFIQFKYFIFGFPTYHCEPSSSMMDFIEKMPRFYEKKAAFVFTTCGLFSGNALRIFIKACNLKNIYIYGYSSYQAPASDGALLFPYINFLFRFGRTVPDQIVRDIHTITDMLVKNGIENKYPRFKLYSIINYPNKYFGKKYKHNLRVRKENCIKCYKCLKDCIRDCWQIIDGKPSYNNSNCEFCFKCIHHCPVSAIILNSKTVKKTKMNDAFFNSLKNKIINDIESSKIKK